MVISASTNTTANTALRYLNQNSAASANSLAKLSSGSRIVKASDDAASLAIGTKIKADVTALKQAQVNASQASSVLQVADGALAQTTDILMRMKALSVQAQSGSVSDNERGFLDKEFQALSSQIDSIAEQTKFNGETLLDGVSAFGFRGTTDGAGAFDAAATNNLALTSNNGFLKDGVEYTLTYAATHNAGDGDNPSSADITFTLSGGGSTATATMTVTNAANGDADVTDVDLGTLVFQDGNGNSVTIGAGDGTVSLPDVATAGVVAGTAIEGGSTFTADVGANFQVGVSSADTINVSLGSIKTDVMGVFDGETATLADSAGDGTNVKASIGTAADAQNAVDIIDRALSQINTARADVGASISRFEFASANVANTIENMDAARSVLMDVDMAAEMSNFSSKQVMLQASVAMLAQANQQPQQLLRLLN